MSNHIADAMGLPRLEDLFPEEPADHSTAVIPTSGDVDAEGTVEHAADTDEIYRLALAAHQDTLDACMNMEPKHAHTMAVAAAQFLEIALKATSSKTDSRLRKKKLQIDEARNRPDIADAPRIIESKGTVVATRNELIRSLRADMENSGQ